FSSRRRHTRFSRDWSSDVCSSDLAESGLEAVHLGAEGVFAGGFGGQFLATLDPVEFDDALEQPVALVDIVLHAVGNLVPARPARSEERRVGKEWRTRRSPEQQEKH